MKTLTVKECSKYIDKSESSVRIGLQRGGYKFGTAIQTVLPTPLKTKRWLGLPYFKRGCGALHEIWEIPCDNRERG